MHNPTAVGQPGTPTGRAQRRQSRVAGRVFWSGLLAALITFAQASPADVEPSTSRFFERIHIEKVHSDDLVEWHSVGPGMSGYNESFWAHPSDPDALFMGPDMHVSYGSWDGGQSWHSIKDPDGLGLEMRRVLDVEFSRQDPNVGMAIDWNGWVYSTGDRGRSWEKIAAFGETAESLGFDPNDPDVFEKGWYYEQQGRRFSELAVDPTNDRIWYIGAGDFWNVKANHRSAARPEGQRFEYAEYGYLLKTEDSGKTWRRLDEGLPADIEFGRILINPTDGSRVVAATSHGLLTSRDGGESWRRDAEGLPNDLPRDLTSHYDPDSGAYTLYLLEQTTYERNAATVSSRGGVFRSDDGGESWVDITGSLAIDLSEISYPDTRERYLRTVAHWFGLSMETASVQFSEPPKAILPVWNRIAVNPLDKDEVYVAYNLKHDRTFGHGDVWRTLDGGRTWTAVARHGEYWRSNTDADYWRGRGNSLGTNMRFAHLQSHMDISNESAGNRMLAMDAAGRVYIGVDQQTLRSTDRGETWQQIDDLETAPGSQRWIGRGASNLPGRFMLHETGIRERRLFASGEHGLWQTVASGDAFGPRAVAVEQIEGQVHEHGAHSISTVAVHPQDPLTIYILIWRQSHYGKLRRTTDGGKSWENIATIFEGEDEGLQNNSAPQNSLLIDPENPDNMYFCATALKVSEIHNGPSPRLSKGGYGVHRSTDGGFSWTLQSSGIHSSASIRRIAMDPADPSVLYAAANDDRGGLYRTRNRGDNWERITVPATIRAVNNVFVDRNNGFLYISAGRNDGALDEGGVWRSEDAGDSWQRIFEAPFVLQAETSPLNPDLIVLSAASQVVRIADRFMNPGIYLSLDGGETFRKINRNLGQPGKVVDIKPDPYNEDVLWAALWGSGWYVGYTKGAAGWLPKD